jgi:phage portal protein BeeE
MMSEREISTEVATEKLAGEIHRIVTLFPPPPQRIVIEHLENNKWRITYNEPGKGKKPGEGAGA